MKKINLLLPALLMCMLLICTGCNNAKLTEIENSATAFLQAADEGNYESVIEHCTKDALVQMNLLSLDPVYSSNSFFLGTGFDRLAFSQEAVTATEEYGKYLADALIQGYTIHEVSEENDVGYVTATITTFAFDTSQPFTSTDFNDKLTTLMTDYTNANMEELSAIYVKGGEVALTLHILDKTIPEIMEVMKQETSTYVLEDIQFKMQLELIEDKWMVTGATIVE